MKKFLILLIVASSLMSCSKVKKLFLSRDCKRGEPNACKKLVQFDKHIQLTNECDQQDIKSCYHLSWVKYSIGDEKEATQILKESLEKGVEQLFKSDCDSGIMEDCTNLAIMYKRDGKLDKSAKIFQEACAKEYFPACSEQGWILQRQEKYKEAEEAYKSACKGGHLDGCLQQAFIRQRVGDYEGALPLYEKACEAGNKKGCWNLAVIQQRLIEKLNNRKDKKKYQKLIDEIKGKQKAHRERVAKEKQLKKEKGNK